MKQAMRTTRRNFASHGPCIYFDTSSKGDGRRHSCWRVEMALTSGGGKRIRRRFKTRGEAEMWLRGERCNKQVFSSKIGGDRPSKWNTPAKALMRKEA